MMTPPMLIENETIMTGMMLGRTWRLRVPHLEQPIDCAA